MLITFIALSFLGLCSSGALYYNLRKVKQSHEQEVNSLKEDCEKKIEELGETFDKEYDLKEKACVQSYNTAAEKYKNECDKAIKEYQDKCEKQYKSLEEEFESRVKSIKDDCRETIKEHEKQFENDMNDQLEEFKNQIGKVDEVLGRRIEEIKQKNTLYFNCVCNPQRPLPCEIDFSQEENYFQCPDCGAVYRVQIDAYPVLISSISTNTRMVDLIEQAQNGGEDNE